MVLLAFFLLATYNCNICYPVKCSVSSSILLNIGDSLVYYNNTVLIKQIKRASSIVSNIEYFNKIRDESTGWIRSCPSDNCCTFHIDHVGCMHYHKFPSIVENNSTTLTYKLLTDVDDTHSEGIHFECPGHSHLCRDRLDYTAGIDKSETYTYKFSNYLAIGEEKQFEIYNNYNTIYGILYNSKILENYKDYLPALRFKGDRDWIINKNNFEPHYQDYYVDKVPLYEGQQICKAEEIVQCSSYEIIDIIHTNCSNCNISVTVDYTSLPCKIFNTIIVCTDNNWILLDRCSNLMINGTIICPDEFRDYENAIPSSGSMIEYQDKEKQKHELFSKSTKTTIIIIVVAIAIILVLLSIVGFVISLLVGIIIIRLIL